MECTGSQANLARLKQVDIRTVNLNILVEIDNTTVNAALPREERILDFIQQIGNPY